MELDNVTAAGGLVQIVDVLRDDGDFFARLLERRKEAVPGVRERLRKVEVLRIIAEE